MKLSLVYKCPSVIFDKHAINIKTLSTKKCKVLAKVQKVIFPQEQLCSWSLLMILVILSVALLLNVAFLYSCFCEKTNILSLILPCKTLIIIRRQEI